MSCVLNNHAQYWEQYGNEIKWLQSRVLICLLLYICVHCHNQKIIILIFSRRMKMHVCHREKNNSCTSEYFKELINSWWKFIIFKPFAVRYTKCWMQTLTWMGFFYLYYGLTNLSICVRIMLQRHPCCSIKLLWYTGRLRRNIFGFWHVATFIERCIQCFWILKSPGVSRMQIVWIGKRCWNTGQ